MGGGGTSTRRWRRRGSPVGVPRREDAIETALRNKLAQRAKAREAQAKAAAKEIAKFTSEFLNARPPASEAFARVDASPTAPRAGRPAMLYYDRQGQLGHARKAGDRPSREGGQKSHRLPQKLRRRKLAIPAAPAAPRQSSRCPGYRQVRGARHRRVYCPASFCVREIRSFDRAPTTQGKPPSTAASRSAWSSWPTSASAASAPRSGPTPNSRSNF